MKTKTTISALPENNEFRIANFRDYNLIEVTASEGKDAVTMSFPWAHSIPYMDVSVQDAIALCEKTTKDALSQRLAAIAQREARMTLLEKLSRFLRREFSYFWAMGKIGVDK